MSLQYSMIILIAVRSGSALAWWWLFFDSGFISLYGQIFMEQRFPLWLLQPLDVGRNARLAKLEVVELMNFVWSIFWWNWQSIQISICHVNAQYYILLTFWSMFCFFALLFKEFSNIGPKLRRDASTCLKCAGSGNNGYLRRNSQKTNKRWRWVARFKRRSGGLSNLINVDLWSVKYQFFGMYRSSLLEDDD